MDTVVEDPYHGVIETVLNGMSFQEWRSYRAPGAFESWECGEISEDEYFSGFYKRTLHPEIRARLVHPGEIKNQLYNKPIQFKTGMKELLKAIRNNGTLALVSNYSPWFSEVLRLRPELCDLFEHRFFSSELGVRKPFPEYYERIAEALKIKADDSVFFIDDRPENLTEPARFGWNAHLFKSSNELLEWIKKLE